MQDRGKVKIVIETRTASRTGTEIGCLAPDFVLKDTDAHSWRLLDHRGTVIVLVFYPRDETPVCTKQMCSMRDRWNDYAATQAEIVGVSVGSVESHKKFAEHHRLPQRLLADEQAQVTELYNVKSLLGGSQRAIIVIDAQGIIRYRKSLLPIFRPSDDALIETIRSVSSGSNS